MSAPHDRRRRTSGLHPPYSIPQASSWILLASLSTFLLLYMPLTPGPFWVYIVLYSGSLLPLLYFGYRVCTVDPCDPLTENSSEQLEASEDLKHCWICRVNVEKSTVHCSRCGKCVAGFDHHCTWLNVCVGHGGGIGLGGAPPAPNVGGSLGGVPLGPYRPGGLGSAVIGDLAPLPDQQKEGLTLPQENYSFFVKTISLSLFHLIVHGIASGTVVIGYFGRMWGIREKASGYAGNLPYPIGVAILSAVLFVMIFPVLTQLLVFHITKIIGKVDEEGKQKTTYGFILAEGRMRREKRQQQSSR